MGITYSVNETDLKGAKFTGSASCEGGHQPKVSLHNYPLLSWMHDGHPKFRDAVFLEDQSASVDEIAAAVPQAASFDALAEKFRTTREHVVQALDYAFEVGCLTEK
jgi:hypothetical protein